MPPLLPANHLHNLQNEDIHWIEREQPDQAHIMYSDFLRATANSLMWPLLNSLLNLEFPAQRPHQTGEHPGKGLL